MVSVTKRARKSAEVAERQALRVLDKLNKADKKTADSFQNYGLNLGIGTDNALSYSTYGFNPITRVRTLLEWIHRGSWLGGVAIDIVADDMTRAGIDISSTMEPGDIEKVENRAMELGIWSALGDTIRWARLYGGACGVYLVDGQDMSKPLKVDRIGKGGFKGILVLDRWMLDPDLNDLVTEFGPDMGKPKFYRVTANAPGLRGKVIHYSRVFRMEGISIPYQQRLMENLWGISVLERLYDRMVAFDSATTGAAQLVYKSHLRHLKIKGLRDIVGTGGKPVDGLARYVAHLSKFQGVEGITVIDADDEFQSISNGPDSGIPAILTAFGEQLAGALEMPLVRLFGQSPAGLNSSGESDIITYYDGIKQKQERTLRIPVRITYEMLARSEGISFGDKFDYEFTPLWQMRESVKAEISARDTESVLSVDTAGILSPKIILQELRERGKKSGRWTNITDEVIETASEELPPPPEEVSPPTTEGGVAEPGEEPPPNATPPGAGGGASPGAKIKKTESPKSPESPAEGKSKLALDAAVTGKIDHSHDVASGSVSNKAGGITYVDRSIRQFSVLPSGWLCNNWKYLSVHEQSERYAMARGLSYDDAHSKVAEPAEHRAVEEDGGDWKEYTHHMDGLLAKIEHEKVKNPPPDPHIDPVKAVRDAESREERYSRQLSELGLPAFPDRYKMLALYKAEVGSARPGISLSEIVNGLHEKRIVKRSSDAGTSNVYNAGICHMGKSGKAGGEAACGNRRAHAVYAYAEFKTIAETYHCVRCHEKMRRIDAIKEKRATGDALPTGDFGGIPIVVECRAGDRRWNDGPVMPADYGYIRRVPSAEGPEEWMDCFVGPRSSSRDVWVVNMIDPETRAFDEHKVMFGFGSRGDAVSAFVASYDGVGGFRGRRRLGDVAQLHLDSAEFREWLAGGDVTVPLTTGIRAA